jgi:hypothetical protein
MIRHCDGTDPNLQAQDGEPCSCGLRFDDVDRMVIFPHHKAGGVGRAFLDALAAPSPQLDAEMRSVATQVASGMAVFR